MKFAHLLSLAAVVGLLNVAAASAGELKIEGVHLCCGQCVTIAQSKLKPVAGVTDAKADKDSGTITLNAADEKAAAAAIETLAKSGFRGKATFGDKELAFPAANVEKGTKADSVTIAGVHLCCPACYKAAEEALKSVDGVSGVTSDKKTKTLEVKGKGVDVNAALGALFEAGFHASVKK
jgi:copper chaperone CopZ